MTDESLPRKKIKLGKPFVNMKTSLQSDFLRVCSRDKSHHALDWPSLLNCIKSKDEEIRWLSSNIIAGSSKMSYSQRRQFLLLHCSQEADIKFSIKYLKNSEEVQKEICNKLDNSSNTKRFILGAVSLPILHQTSKKGGLLELSSTRKNLEAIAMSINLNFPVLLEGIVGSGKTCLVKYLADATGREKAPHLTMVQLGGQTDCKSLIGTYRCTKNPGEFVWQAGSITKCVMEGHWLMLEDINMAPMEVISHLLPLVELRCLPVPGYGTIKAHKNFHLFATMRKLDAEREIVLGPVASIENFFKRVCLQSMTTDELKSLVLFRFPKIPEQIVNKLIEIYLIVSGKILSEENYIACENCKVVQDVMSMTSARLVSVRDLLKLSQRINAHVEDKDINMRLYNESFDCFCAAVPDGMKRKLFAYHIAFHLGISSQIVQLHHNNYHPKILVTNKQFVVGDRARIPLKTGLTRLFPGRREGVFSETKPSSCLLERIMIATAQKEPVLLVGETGTGKTSTVQYLAKRTGNKLNVLNMNQQSDSSDLLGGFKPIELSTMIKPVRARFEELFSDTFKLEDNTGFLQAIANKCNHKRWHVLLPVLIKAAEKAVNMTKGTPINEEWVKFIPELRQCERVIEKSAVAFSYIEGALVRAVTAGEWVLLDEVNLAGAETLECLCGLLESADGSITLHERGDYKPIKRHPNFQLFACMNPATDVGKKELPAGLRSRFTEFYMDEFTDMADLMQLVTDYLSSIVVLDLDVRKRIVEFYLEVRQSARYSLADGTNSKPHISLRTLCRALSVAKRTPATGTLRPLFEAICLSFLTQLNRKSYYLMLERIKKIFDQCRIPTLRSMGCPGNKEDYVEIEKYWIPRGKNPPNKQLKYIMTPTVNMNLCDLARNVSLGRYPVLLQGDTSVGKTSLIKFLAELTGNTCVRINNHQHTDIQEYIGCYGPDETGKLVFKKGALVNAMERGEWVILDELNLAPTDVLEALNRLLDDNKELFIPEIGQTIKAHPQFMLFATQNPPKQYGGRQVLSRAFRNRFIELHFDLIPTNELTAILHRRCDIPMSYCEKMVAVHEELQRWRRETNLFEGKQSFITLRDLFRWAERYRLAPKQTSTFYDWRQHLAEEGYLILAGRVRTSDEEAAVRQVLESKLLYGKGKETSSRNSGKIDVNNLFTLNGNTSPVTRTYLEQISSIEGFEHIVWTYDMRRLFVLVAKSLSFSEPVLLVGDTGCGKTSACQMIAALTQKVLRTVNCHMHSEGADFLGGIRPTRDRQASQGKMFEWVDGPLVRSMKEEGLFLADEISLADDSVLERLNSVLEPERTLILTEKGTETSEVVVAAEGFRFVATMNPGGDFGKKELSTALRNRFTEIWCPKINVTDDTEDVVSIVEHNIAPGIILSDENSDSGIGRAMLSFLKRFVETRVGKKCTFSVRDLLSWITFINKVTRESDMPIELAYVHGACLVILDGLGSGATGGAGRDWRKGRDASLKYLCWQVSSATKRQLSFDSFSDENIGALTNTTDLFGVGPFSISKEKDTVEGLSFNFRAPQTSINLLRLLRGMQLSRPVLLEGSPGVGKTSLVTALAKQSGNDIIRINLSEQTDVSDLFGADFPVEGEKVPRFAWRDGPLLQALKSGSWVVFDELNLASQPVLEGLNACFDHRGEIFVPELNKIFKVEHQRTKIFACQNPQYEGGARKGLPKSFLNRFTQVFVEPFSARDLQFILISMYEEIPEEILRKMVEFNDSLIRDMDESHWGRAGGPWEFNLRDMFRWCDIMKTNQHVCYNPGEFVSLIYGDRLRKPEDQDRVTDLYSAVFGPEYPLYKKSGRFSISTDRIQFGRASITRSSDGTENDDFTNKNMYILNNQTPNLESLVHCVNMNWMVIMVGASGEGKTTLVQLLAKLCGKNLRTFPVNSEMDVTELLGGFEQADQARHLQSVKEHVEVILLQAVRTALLSKKMTEAGSLLLRWDNFSKSQDENNKEEPVQNMTKLCTLLRSVISELQKIISDTTLSEELAKLKCKCSKINSQVVKSTKITGGGTFEWVDSVLVKAVINGEWVLIDGVNLCSPSVLDRLNGLLEPGGVLTLNEKGAVNGEIPSLAPHPNFRLFLAMDPKHGELSRAMRNRGIELCLTRSWDHTLDIQSLMLSAGLGDAMVQNALYSIHRIIMTKLPGYERPKINVLIQAAQQIAQHMEMGISWNDALKGALQDCYVNTAVSSVGKKTIQEIMSSELSESLMEDDCIGYQRMDLILRISDLSKNHDVAFANQVHSLVSLLCSVEQNILQRWQSAALPLPLNVPFETRTPEALLPTMLILLAGAPCSQWLILLELCNQNHFKGSCVASSLINKVMQVFHSGTVDHRFDGSTLNQSQIDEQSSESNINLLGLWSTALRTPRRNEAQYFHSKIDIHEMSILELSRAIANKAIANPFKIRSGIKYIYNTIMDTEDFLMNLPVKNDLICSDDLYFKILSGYRWMRELYTFCRRTVKVREIGEIASQISFFWEMIHDELFSVIPSHWLSTSSSSLTENVHQMNAAFKLKHGPAEELVSRLPKRKSYMAFYSKAHYDSYERLYEILSRIQPNLESPLVNAILANNGMQMKAVILRIAAAILEHNSHCYQVLSDPTIAETDLGNEIIELKNQLASDMTNFEGTMEEISLSITTDQYNATIQMWPIFDHFACKCLEDRTQNSPEIFKMASHIPPNILWMLNDTNRLSYSLIYMFRISSCTTRNVVDWMSYSDERPEDDVPPSGDMIFSDACVLSYLFVSGTFCSDKELEKIKVGSHFDQRTEFKQFQSILYNNWNYLKDHHNSSSNSYSKDVHNSTSEFMNLLLKATTSSDVDIDVLSTSLIERVLASLRKGFKCDSPVDEGSILEELFNNILEAIKASGNSSDIINSAKLGITSGLLQTWLLSHMELLDPMIRRDILLTFYDNEYTEFSQLIDAHKWMDILRFGQENIDSHLHKSYMENRLEPLHQKIDSLNKEISYRQGPSHYYKMVIGIREFVSNVFSPFNVIALMNKILKSGDKNSIQEVTNVLHSWENFVKSMINTYALYRDLLIPILDGICLASEGFRILISNAQRATIHKKLHLTLDVSKFICEMLAFPAHRRPNMTEELSRISDLHSDAKLAIVNGIGENNGYITCMTIRSMMYDLYNCILSEKRLTACSFVMFDNLIRTFFQIWQLEEEKRREKERKDESLYVHVKTETEDEEIEREFEELFPRHIMELDHEDQESMEVGDSDNCKESSNNLTFDEEHIRELISMHQTIMSISVANSQPSIATEATKSNLFPCTPHLLRLKQMQVLFKHLGPFGSQICDAESLSGILVSNYLCLSVIEGGVDLDICKKPFNFYKDPAPNESVKVVGILKDLNSKTNALLRTWEEHPSLVRIKNVIKRVLNFSVTSPLIKLVNGLQSVLAVSQEWQRFAHKGVLLDLDPISDQIGEWRKLELSNWRMCLEMVSYDVSCMSSKWWWHLYATLLDSIQVYNPKDLPQLIANLKTLMESSPSGQYKERLQFLLSFHHHLCYIIQTDDYTCDKRTVRLMMNLTWNIYRYYWQFSSANEKILECNRKPIEKTIREFVKISRWNDKNFFSIQESVNKSHRILHREMRKWKKALLQVVALSDSNLTLDNSSLSSQNDSTSEEILRSLIIIKKMKEPPSKLISYIPKCSRFMAKIIVNSTHTLLCSTFDELSCDVITSLQESTDAMTAATKITDQDLKIKKVKEVIHRKRTLLANMFKTLKAMGISYTKGYNLRREDDLDKCLVVAPIKGSSFHQSIYRSHFEKACERFDHYFFRNIARLSLLNGMLEKPHTDLGPELIKIIKGSSHFSLLLIKDLRNKVPVNSLCQFRFLVDELQKATNGLASSSASFSDRWLLLASQLSSLLLGLGEAKVLISAYVSDEPLVTFQEGSSFSKDCMLTCKTQLEALELKVSGLIMELNSQFMLVDQRTLSLCHARNLAKLDDIYERAMSVSHELKHGLIINSATESEGNLLRELSLWTNAFEETYAGFINWRSSITIVEICESQVQFVDNGIFEKLFCCVQKLYKLFSERKNEDPDSVPTIDHMRRQGEDIRSLGIRAMTGILTSVTCSLQENPSCNTLLGLKCYLPILQSYIVFCDNLILSYIKNLTAFSKLQSVIVGVYLQLGQKGYCRPVDIEFDGEGEGTFSFEESGPGLAEGEGTKDVSDKLESEDQVESALQEGEKEKSAEEECAEEETGVEMNQDFEGKLQDIDQKEEEEGENSDDETEELDKQMDQTDEGAEKLDEKMWDDDDDDDDAENQERRTEEGTSKEQTEKSDEIVAMDGEPEKNEKNPGDEYAEGGEETPDIDIDKEETINDAAESKNLADEERDSENPEEDPGPEENEQSLQEETEQSQIEETEQPTNEIDEDANQADDDADEEETLEGDTANYPEDQEEDAAEVDDPPEAIPDDKFDGNEGNDDTSAKGGTGETDNENREYEKKNNDIENESTERTENSGQGQCNNADDSPDGEAISSTNQPNMAPETSRRTKAGQSDEKRVMGQPNQHVDRSINTTSATDANDDINDEKKDASLYKHLTDPNQHWDKQTTDAATDNQVDEMPPTEDDSKQKEDTANFENEKDIEENDFTKKRKAEEALSVQDKKRLKPHQNVDEDDGDESPITRGPNAKNQHSGNDIVTLISSEDEAARKFFNRNVDHTFRPVEVLETGDVEKGIMEWNKVDQKVTPYALELCQQLRLVLEPTQASKLKGDFRTGKRLNMRKIIPYIASDFRKDKIWLRRTLPNKRTYQILIAIDDSESMTNVKAAELAKEGLAMVAKALDYLEAGSVGILSFGTKTKVLHEMHQPFSDQAGAKVFSNLEFRQNESNFSQMLEDASGIFSGAAPKHNTEQLLIILSDGQTHANSESVRRRVRAIRDQGVFVVFVVLDPEEGKPYSFHSVTVWDDKNNKLIPIMDVFPFPFFLVVRNLANLPSVLSTALRQWFQLIA